MFSEKYIGTRKIAKLEIVPSMPDLTELVIYSL